MIPCDRHPYAPSQMYMCYILYIIFLILIIMSEEKVEVREVEPVKRKTLERRSARSGIILVELKSVADASSPIKAEDVKEMGKKIISMFPNGIQLDNLVEATIITLKEVSKIYKLKQNIR